jgi:hypothetical protein
MHHTTTLTITASAATALLCRVYQSVSAITCMLLADVTALMIASQMRDGTMVASVVTAVAAAATAVVAAAAAAVA